MIETRNEKLRREINGWINYEEVKKESIWDKILLMIFIPSIALIGLSIFIPVIFGI